MKIKPISEFFEHGERIDNSCFFYISNTKKIIPWYDIFVYYFYIIDNELYINDFEFTELIHDYFIKSFRVSSQDHLDLLRNENCTLLQMDKVIFITHMYTNIGHALQNLIQAIYFVKEKNLSDYTIVITEDLLRISKLLTSIVYLFFRNVRVINEKTLVKFEKSYLIKGCSSKNDIECKYFINCLKNSIDTTKTNQTFENICIIKNDNPNNTSKGKSFNLEYNEFIKEKGFDIVNPEIFSIDELFPLIYNAKNIIFSWGLVSYLNSIFCNERGNVLVLCHIDYKPEYEEVKKYPSGILDSHWLPFVSNKKLIIYDLNTNFTKETSLRLNNGINKLLA